MPNLKTVKYWKLFSGKRTKYLSKKKINFSHKYSIISHLVLIRVHFNNVLTGTVCKIWRVCCYLLASAEISLGGRVYRGYCMPPWTTASPGGRGRAASCSGHCSSPPAWLVSRPPVHPWEDPALYTHPPPSTVGVQRSRPCCQWAVRM